MSLHLLYARFLTTDLEGLPGRNGDDVNVADLHRESAVCLEPRAVVRSGHMRGHALQLDADFLDGIAHSIRTG